MKKRRSYPKQSCPVAQSIDQVNPKPMSDEDIARITALAKRIQRQVDGEEHPARPEPKLVYQPRVPPPPPTTENHAPGGGYDAWRDDEDWRSIGQTPNE